MLTWLTRCSVKDGYPSVAGLVCGYKMTKLQWYEPKFYIQQWHHNSSKIIFLPIPGLISAATSRIPRLFYSRQAPVALKFRFEQLWKYKTWNNWNFLAVNDWAKVILNCNDKLFFLLYLYLYLLCNMVFFTLVRTSHIHQRYPCWQTFVLYIVPPTSLFAWCFTCTILPELFSVPIP